MATSANAEQSTRRVGLGLGIGILLIPVIFAWFTLREGYSTRARVVSFAWLIFTLLAFFGTGRHGPSPRIGQAPSAQSVSATADAAEPETAEVDDTVTAAEYEQLRTGMSYKQAAKIVGFEGEEMSSSDLAGYQTVMVAWKNADGSNMNAMFQNGRMVTKAQFGLR